MKVVGLIVVLLSLFVFIFGIMNLSTGGTDTWPYFALPIGPFIWGIIQLTKKRRKVVSMGIEQIKIFQKENCIGCRFANEDAINKGEYPWCKRPELPELDEKLIRCLSKEKRKEEKSVSMPR